MGVAGGCGLGREAFARFGGTFAIPSDCQKIERTDCVKEFDSHKICVTLPLSATHLKGGDPVSRVILERRVGTVMGGVF